MNVLRGRNALLTGANGGLGAFIADALSAAGVNVFLVDVNDAGLASRTAEAVARGVRAGFLAADLRDPLAREQAVAAARRNLGPVDLLINNAGVEYSARYDELSPDQIEEVIAVNLRAPMLLARLVLPEMRRRGTGHIVNLSSLAGESGPAFQESYAATKAGLTAFTFSLRATFRGTGVSASVVTPGFVDTGIYARLKSRTGVAAPPLLAPVPPARVAAAVLRAIREDRPEIIVSRYPVRPVMMALALWPRLGLWLITRLGTHDFFRRVVDAEQRLGPGTPPSDGHVEESRDPAIKPASPSGSGPARTA
jgi:NAD(P)-dependent dehydrogenase (short-subunit alcohol dehydrogenase family)